MPLPPRPAFLTVGQLREGSSGPHDCAVGPESSVRMVLEFDADQPLTPVREEAPVGFADTPVAYDFSDDHHPDEIGRHPYTEVLVARGEHGVICVRLAGVADIFDHLSEPGPAGLQHLLQFCS